MKKFLLFVLSMSLLLPFSGNAQCSISVNGSDSLICTSQGAFPIQANATGYSTYAWTTSGTGSFSTTTYLGTVYSPSPADIAAGSVSLSITASGGCSAKTAVAVVTFVPVPTVNAGADQTSCGTVSLNASVTNAGGVRWISSGSGTFSNQNAASTTYTPGAFDLSVGSATLYAIPTNSYCVGDSDKVVITFLPANIVSAGIDLTTCQNSPVTISGSSVTNSTSVLWTTSGTGTFSSNTVLHPTYQPSAADIAAGSAILTVTATGSGSCPSAMDTIQLNITTTGPSVNAGPDQSICDNYATLNATFSGAGGVFWTSTGSGSFSDSLSASTLYYPSVADRTAGTVTFTATTTSNGSCPTASDEVVVTIDKRVRLIVGADITACPNAPVFPVASVDAGTVTWTSSGTGTFSKTTSLTPVYTPSAADNATGHYVLTAISSTNGSCPAEADSMFVTLIGTTATANAGPDQTICGNSVVLNGSVTNASGGIWTSSGTGTFSPGANYLNTTYTLSAADIAAGSVALTLTTTGTCGVATTDVVVITATGSSLPVVNAGPDQNVTGTTVTLNGTATGTSSVAWSTSGSGTFSSSTTLSTIYTPSTIDIANGLVELTLTGMGSGSCPAVQDKLLVTLGNTFSITGTVKASTNLLDAGFVFLFKKDGSNLDFIAADSLISSDAGTYNFDHVPIGSYIILAIPSGISSYVNSFLPTYSGNTQDWNSAQPIIISAGTSYNISLTPYSSADPSWNTGSDTIAGVVYMDQTIPAAARVQTTGNTPAAYVTVYLTDANGNKIAYTQTDINGRYSFANVEAGKYAVAPDFAGTGLPGSTTSIPVVSDGNPATIEDASMTIQEKVSMITGIIPSAKSVVLTAYPNPAKSTVTLNLTTSAGSGVVKLFNESGIAKFQQEVDLSGSSVILNIESLPAGMYILQLIAQDEVYTSKVVKY